MAVMLFIEYHIEITAVDACLLHSADLRLKSMSGNPLEHMQEFLLIRSEVEQRSHCHVAADPRSALQIQNAVSILHLNHFLRKPGD